MSQFKVGDEFMVLDVGEYQYSFDKPGTIRTVSQVEDFGVGTIVPDMIIPGTYYYRYEWIRPVTKLDKALK